MRHLGVASEGAPTAGEGLLPGVCEGVASHGRRGGEPLTKSFVLYSIISLFYFINYFIYFMKNYFIII